MCSACSPNVQPKSRSAGKFIVSEIALNAIATALSVMIMYLHSKSAFGDPVPRWLINLFCIPYCRNRKISMVQENDKTIELISADKTAIDNIHTAVS
jgi:hypothetical protein